MIEARRALESDAEFGKASRWKDAVVSLEMVVCGDGISGRLPGPLIVHSYVPLRTYCYVLMVCFGFDDDRNGSFTEGKMSIFAYRSLLNIYI